MNRSMCVICLVIFNKFSFALNNGLALTPPMGWMSWQRYRCTTDCENYPDDCISEKLIKNVAKLLVDEGYKDVGYEYVIIDDCWLERSRTKEGKLQGDLSRFPNGIKYLSDYIHSVGLKFGIYEDYGIKTCEGYPGIVGYMKEDANTFAEWEVDYIKIDGCNSRTEDLENGYLKFGRYLNETGRKMVYSCSWPVYQELNNYRVNYDLVAKHCNLWRNFLDIYDSWQSLTTIIDYYAFKQDIWQPNAGPGHWNDPDMLIIGNYGLSYDQSKTQMAIWAILAAPLIMSTDLRTIKTEFKEILQNKAIIDINQDSLGIQGKIVFVGKPISVWNRPIMPITQGEYSYAIAFLNRRTYGGPYLFRTTLKNIGLYNIRGYKFQDLFDSSSDESNSFVVKPNMEMKVRINPSGVMFYRAIAL